MAAIFGPGTSLEETVTFNREERAGERFGVVELTAALRDLVTHIFVESPNDMNRAPG